jgi:hypothetical protein
VRSGLVDLLVAVLIGVGGATAGYLVAHVVADDSVLVALVVCAVVGLALRPLRGRLMPHRSPPGAE